MTKSKYELNLISSFIAGFMGKHDFVDESFQDYS